MSSTGGGFRRAVDSRPVFLTTLVLSSLIFHARAQTQGSRGVTAWACGHGPSLPYLPIYCAVTAPNQKPVPTSPHSSSV